MRLLVGLAQQGRHERNAVGVHGWFHTRQLASGWQKIPKGQGFVAHGPRGNGAGPPGDGRSTDAAFVQVAFEAAERTVGIKKRVLVASLAMRTVVRRENDERVFLDLQFPNKIHNATDIPVHPSDHGCESLLGVRPVAFRILAIVGHFHPVARRPAAFVVRMRDGPVYVQQEGFISMATDESERRLGHNVVRVGLAMRRQCNSPPACRRLHQPIPLQHDAFDALALATV